MGACSLDALGGTEQGGFVLPDASVVTEQDGAASAFDAGHPLDSGPSAGSDAGHDAGPHAQPDAGSNVTLDATSPLPDASTEPDASSAPDAAPPDHDSDDDGFDDDEDCAPNDGDVFPGSDFDQDGFAACGADCDDRKKKVGPKAVEFNNGFDDNCNGTIDEAPVPCDTPALSASTALDYPKAIGLCRGEVVSAAFEGFAGPNGPQGRSITSQFGTATAQLNRPSEGNKLVVLSSGSAGTSNHDNGVAFDNSFATASCRSAAHPAPKGDPGACGAADPETVCDLAKVTLTLRVPVNAEAFSFDHQFFTAEYPSFRCWPTDDTFLALLKSTKVNGNVVYDASGLPISTNSSFLDLCLDDDGNSDLNDNGITSAFELSLRPSPVPANDCTDSTGAAFAGTGYIHNNTPNPVTLRPYSEGAAATRRLTTRVPVTPGEQITLSFVIFDEGDDMLDSSVLIDNFRWSPTTLANPVTQIAP